MLLQIIIFMALANGKSQVKCREITLHTKTAIYVAEQFTDVRYFINLKFNFNINHLC